MTANGKNMKTNISMVSFYLHKFISCLQCNTISNLLVGENGIIAIVVAFLETVNICSAHIAILTQ